MRNKISLEGSEHYAMFWWDEIWETEKNLIPSEKSRFCPLGLHVPFCPHEDSTSRPLFPPSWCLSIAQVCCLKLGNA